MSQENEPAERVQPEQTQQPTQSTEDAVRRLTGVPKTAEELEEERLAAEEERRTRFTESRQGTAETQGQSEHPLGGPPGQTGEHPHGNPPGQTDAHPPQPGPTPPEPEPKDEPECEPTAETESTP
jgi:hypothetical protein